MTPTTRLSADERRDEIVAAAMTEFAADRLCRDLDRGHRPPLRRQPAVPVPAVRDQEGPVHRRGPPRLRPDVARLRDRRPRRPRGGPSTEHVLDAMGCGLLRPAPATASSCCCQLQAYAACGDPEIREAVGDEWMRLYRMVGDLSGADDHDARALVREGHADEHRRRHRPRDGRGRRLLLRLAREDRRCPMTPPSRRHPLFSPRA